MVTETLGDRLLLESPRLNDAQLEEQKNRLTEQEMRNLLFYSLIHPEGLRIASYLREPYVSRSDSTLDQVDCYVRLDEKYGFRPSQRDYVMMLNIMPNFGFINPDVQNPTQEIPALGKLREYFEQGNSQRKKPIKKNNEITLLLGAALQELTSLDSKVMFVTKNGNGVSKDIRLRRLYLNFLREAFEMNMISAVEEITFKDEKNMTLRLYFNPEYLPTDIMIEDDTPFEPLPHDIMIGETTPQQNEIFEVAVSDNKTKRRQEMAEMYHK
jgi:hypothetical protein